MPWKLDAQVQEPISQSRWHMLIVQINNIVFNTQKNRGRRPSERSAEGLGVQRARPGRPARFREAARPPFPRPTPEASSRPRSHCLSPARGIAGPVQSPTAGGPALEPVRFAGSGTSDWRYPQSPAPPGPADLAGAAPPPPRGAPRADRPRAPPLRPPLPASPVPEVAAAA